MDIATGVAGLIGLAGQTLQGINYLLNFFDDVRTAPKTITDIKQDLDLVRSVLEAAKEHSNQIPSSSAAILEGAIPGLQSVVEDFTTFIEKSAGDIQNKPSGRRKTLKKGWQRCNIARKDKELIGFGNRLLQAKQSLMASIQSTSIIVSQTAYMTLYEKQDTLQNVLQQEIGGIHNDVQAVLHGSQAIVNGLATVHGDFGNNMVKLHDTMNQNHTEMLDKMSEQFTGLDEVRNLPLVLRSVLREFFPEAVSQHLSESSDAFNSKQKGLAVHSDSNSNIGRSQNLYREAPKTEALLGSTISPPTTSYSHCLSLQFGPKRQSIKLSYYNLWFGKLEIKTTKTEQDEVGPDGKVLDIPLKAQYTTITFRPATRFLRKGITIQTGSESLSLGTPWLDCPFRVFNTYQDGESPPILQAISSCNYQMFRELLDARQATPFDVFSTGSHFLGRFRPPYNLFTKVIDQLEHLVNNTRHPGLNTDIRSLLMMAECTAKAGGIENGDLLSTLFPLYIWDYSSYDRIELLQQLCGLVIQHSREDPCVMLSIYASIVLSSQGKRSGIGTHLMHQETWDLEDSKNEVEYLLGKGSWVYCLEEGKTDWKSVLRQKWNKTPQCKRNEEEWRKQTFGYSHLPDLKSWKIYQEKYCRCTDCTMMDIAMMFDHGTWELREQADCQCFECREVFLKDYSFLLGDIPMGNTPFDSELEDDDEAYETADEG